MDDRTLAETVLALVGGAENVEDVTACWSRLRLVLRDWDARDDEAITALDEVPMVQVQGGQFQVVLGARAIPVSRVVRELLHA
ncbi:PTS transporter subunit EIIB [Cellulomonas sp. NPDC089187]|uniref:PTS transporter subunit EIIB n=1 Tax=Cellulomonas sp. NPDC089187 TaxID=3154970 RepID=UPI0034458153